MRNQLLLKASGLCYDIKFENQVNLYHEDCQKCRSYSFAVKSAMRHTASLRLSREVAYDSLKYPSPHAPNEVPHAAATPASVSSLSQKSKLVSPKEDMFGKA